MTAVVDAFRRILRSLRVASRQTQMVAGVSAAQLFVLQTLADGSECSLSEIAARTLTDRTSVAAVVERLLERGLVAREPSQHDRRRAAITITPQGRALLRRAPEPPGAILMAGLDGLSGPELASLSRGLVALTRAMALSGEPAGMLFDDGEETARPPLGRRTS